MYTSFLQIIRLRCVLNCLLFLVSKKWEAVQNATLMGCSAQVAYPASELCDEAY